MKLKRLGAALLCAALLFSLMAVGASAANTSSQDGNYFVDIVLKKEKKDEDSMGNVAFKNNPKALVSVKNGAVTNVQIGTNPARVGTYTTGVTKIKIDDAQVNVVSTMPIDTKNGDKILNHYDYISCFQFNMPAAGQPTNLAGKTYLNVHFLVPDTPMGDDFMHARLMFDWDKKTPTTETKLNVNNEISGGVADIYKQDKASGIAMKSNTGVLDLDTDLTVKAVTYGADYQLAAKAMQGISGWSLYSVNTTLNGQVVKPKGSVNLFFPTKSNSFKVYRINPSGNKTTLSGTISNGQYTFSTRTLGLFAIVGKLNPPASVLDVFTDMPRTHWAFNYVDTIVNLGLFKGITPTTFCPENSMNRAMFVTVLGRLAGVDKNGSGETKFTDVLTDQYFSPYVAWAAENGIVAGTSATTFSPLKPVTREQMAVFLYRYCNYANIQLKDGPDITFADEDQIFNYAKEAVSAAAKAGLINGTGNNKFSPKSTAKRAQVAKLLACFIEDYDLMK